MWVTPCSFVDPATANTQLLKLQVEQNQNLPMTGSVVPILTTAQIFSQFTSINPSDFECLPYAWFVTSVSTTTKLTTHSYLRKFESE